MYFIILVFALLFAVSRCEGKLGGSACTGCTTTCILLPPEGVSFPCYQGTPDDAPFCFKSDPILKDGTTWFVLFYLQFFLLQLMFCILCSLLSGNAEHAQVLDIQIIFIMTPFTKIWSFMRSPPEGSERP